MCGIAGVIADPSRYSTELRSSFVSAALTTMQHRGPDGVGVRELADGWVLFGHRRLAIIDLSDGGAQPQTALDGQVTIVYNGELYNHLELRQELAAAGWVFTGDSDTEVLLGAYCTWGRSCVQRFVGMWAFALWDDRTGEAWLCRDPFGIKPLFVRNDGGLWFSSEVEPLVRSHDSVNLQVAYDYLRWSLVDQTTDSFVSGISSVAPGSSITADRFGTVTRNETYWKTPDRLSGSDLSYQEAVRAVRAVLTTSVDLHLRADVRVGAALSGGIDSSSLVCLMREALGPDRAIQTFSYAASESSLDESRWADVVNRSTSAEGHRVAVDDHDWMDLLSETIHAQFEPFGSPSIVAQHAVYRAAGRAGTKVMLDGQGADELFAGYPSFLTEAIGDEVRSGRLLQAFRLMRALSRQSGPASAARALARALPRSLAIALWKAWMDRSAPQWLDVAWFEDRGVRTMSDPATLAKSFDDAVERSQDRTSLPALLRYADRNSMASAVESRVPFLTTELAMLAARLPQHYLISRDGTPKQVLRDAMANVVPAEVLARRDKIAFQVPHSVRASMLERSVSVGLLPPLAFLRGVGDSTIVRTPLPWAPTNLAACAQRWSLSW